MAIVTGDRYLDYLVKFVDKQAGPLLEGTLVLKLNPVGLHYVQSRLEALQELERLLAAAPIDYLRAYVSDLGDHRALEQLRRILRLLTSLKVVSVFPPPARDPTPLSLLPFGRLKYLELRGCDLSTSAARGLLELRHTLEKFICHNSTDALRHVFASRIVDIRKSPVWNRLSFVSCACNALVLMDESLQLLPAVETLDLSRNKFAKVDNLRKCTKLRFLDLGFNHLRTITSFSEVSCSIAKLVLRNNALTSLRGIENLKLLEGLDLSYNIISNFSELEILTSLPSLQSLWLEGNPICCARWYRSQVFSFFTYPQRLKLDDKLISKRETWKRQIILARRQKRPAGFGFYSPATHDAEGEGNFNMKKKKFSRLASIEDDEQRRYTCSDSVDHDAGSCDSEIRSREESIISDGETEIVGLVNRIESMKKERSFLWLRDLKEWMDQNSENVGENRNFTGQNSFPGKEISIKNVKRQKNFGNSSRYVTESVQASGDENSTNILESENSFADSSIDFHAHQYFDLNQEMVLDLPVGVNDTFLPDRFAVQGNDNMDVKVNTPLTAIDEIMESYSSSACPSSPPHYQEDILHRRHNLEEEFIQLSADSYSVASSDSDTSSSEDNFYQYGTSLYEVDGLQHKKSLSTMERSMNDNMHILLSNDNYYDKTDKELGIVRQNGRTLLDTSIDHGFSIVGVGRLKPDNAQQSFTDNILFSASNSGIDHVMSQQADSLEKKRFRTKPKRRIISLSEENCMASNAEVSYQELNNTPEVCKAKMEDEPQNQIPRMISPPLSENDIFIKNYFHSKVADATVSETCMQYIRCDSILEQESGYQEREVALLLSSENKLYILLIDVTSDGSG